MDSRQLQCFIAAAKEKSIIKAADYLPLTPSAIAKKIIALEEELGVALFERLARGVRLTPAGEVWIEHAHQLLDEIEQASHVVHRAAQEFPLRRLDIGIPASNLIGVTALDRILAVFSANNPDVDIVIHKMLLRQQQLEALRQGIILAAFNCSFPNTPDLVIDKFAQENIQLVTSTDHPLANHCAVHIDKLRDLSIIGFQEAIQGSIPSNNSFATAFKIHNIYPKVGHTSSDVFAHLGLSACGQGVALLSPILQTLRFPGVKFIPLLSDFPLTVPYQCAYLKRQSSPLLKELIRSIQSYRNEKNPNASGS